MVALEAAQEQIAAQAEQLALNAEFSSLLPSSWMRPGSSYRQQTRRRHWPCSAAKTPSVGQLSCHTELDHAHMDAEQSAAAAQQVEDALRSDADRLRTSNEIDAAAIELAEREQEAGRTAGQTRRDYSTAA